MNHITISDNELMDLIEKILGENWWEWVFSGVGPWLIGGAASVAVALFARKKYFGKQPQVSGEKVEGSGHQVIQGSKNSGNNQAEQIGTVIQRDQNNFTVNNGFTQDQCKKLLEEQRQAIREEMRAAAGNEEKLMQLKQKHSVVQNKLADLQDIQIQDFLYISENKINRYWAQVPGSCIAKYEKEIGHENSNHTEFSKVKIIEKFMEETMSIGTIEKPKKFFKGILSMKYAIIKGDNSIYIYFGGRNDNRSIALVGSPKHFIGSELSSLDSRGTSVYFSKEILEAFELSSDEIVRATGYHEDPDLDVIEFFVECFDQEIPGNSLKIEFLATKLGTSKDSILGTPVYIMSAD